jgi:hypothetical protein
MRKIYHLEDLGVEKSSLLKYTLKKEELED